MFTRAEYGTYRANEWHVEALPRVHRPGQRLVIWCHEHGASGLTWPAVRAAQGCDAIADAGLAGASADLGGPQNWGNGASVAAIDQLWALMQSRHGVAADKVLLMCGSMGNFAAFNYARANPGKVAAIASILPAVDLAFFHDTNPQGTDTASIEAAYGGAAAYAAALPTSSPNAHRLGGNAGGIPVRVWYSTDDTLAVPATALAFAAAIGASTVSLGAVGHTFGGPGFNRADLANFLRRYA